MRPCPGKQWHESQPQLDPQETTVPTPPKPLVPDDGTASSSVEVCFRHSGSEPTRLRVLKAFERLGVSESRYYGYEYCGHAAWIVQDARDPGVVAVRSERCHDRWCPACARERGTRYAHRLREVLDGKQCRFITLTLKGSDTPLKETLNRLTKAFAALRRTEVWKATQHGGVATLELKLGKTSNQWHPHLHVLTYGRYLAKGLLKQAWLAVTGDSYIVDVRAVRSPEDLTSYVTKYVTKPLHPAVIRQPDRLDEAIVAMKGKRVLNTFGRLRGVQLTLNADAEREWTPVMRLSTAIDRAKAGDAFAQRLLDAIRRQARSPGVMPVEPHDDAYHDP
jgi:hypothetical protein